MLHFLSGKELLRKRSIRDSMFKDRAELFGERLGWDVNIDQNGHERDAYDAENPLYIIWTLENGLHGGSMRILPTVGNTMLNDHFTHLSENVRIKSPFIWECTRFCVPHRVSSRRISAIILHSVCVLGRESNLTYYAGVFDRPMDRVYKRIGWEPDVIGYEQHQKSVTCLGLWPIEAAAERRLENSSGLSYEYIVSRMYTPASVADPE